MRRNVRLPIAPYGPSHETRSVGAVGIDAPERTHAAAAVVRPREEDPITLGRELDDVPDWLGPARAGQRRHLACRHVEHTELGRLTPPLRVDEGDPITGWRPYGVLDPTPD